MSLELLKTRSYIWGLVAASVISLLHVYPLLVLWQERGRDYNGYFAFQQYDEEVYAGYINSLILGRSRLSDPMQCGTTSEYESLFSIQFVPAYLIALPARVLGITPSTAFILTGLICAFASALAVYVLISDLTNSSLIAAAGAVCVLCLGTMLSSQGLMAHLLGDTPRFHGLLFMRRYLPAVPFPLFFLFCVMILRGFNSKIAPGYIIGAGFILILLVFSYFYLWTAAIAWLVCFTLIRLLVARKNYLTTVVGLLPIISAVAMSGLLYGRMLKIRSPAFDGVQALELTRSPDLFRICEVVSFVILAILILLILTKYGDLKEPITIFTLSILLLPFLVFNQQIITGLSLQPYHYEFYVVNYLTVLAAVTTAWIFWRKLKVPNAVFFSALGLVVLTALSWGALEVRRSTNIQHKRNVLRDELISVAQELEGGGVVYSEDVWIVANHISTLAPVSVVWGLHIPICVGITPIEAKERFYRHLYYSGRRASHLEEDLKEKEYVTSAMLFGFERAGPKLLEGSNPISEDEIRREVDLYGDYISKFSYEQATNPLISYVITTPAVPEFPRTLERWYMKDGGEQIGSFTLYRLKPRIPESEYARQ